MSNVTLRELSRTAGRVVSNVHLTGEPAFVTKRGKLVAAVVPIADEAVADWVLANSPEFTRSMAAAGRDLRRGRTLTLNEAFASLEKRPTSL
jgi:prevent-host-death family protein